MHIRLVVAILIAFTSVINMVHTAEAAEIIHPSLYLTSQDIECGKENIRRYAWARKLFQSMKMEADKWAAMSDAELRDAVPPAGAIYAYGFAGCPECHVSWPTWGARDLCDFSRPRTAKCPSCGRVFPDEEHPDTGKGWVDENGKHYYFVGSYNSYCMQQLSLTVLDALCNVYVLTGDEKYAHAASVIMDRIAAVYPTCTLGSIDYPNAPGGRFERTQYQVARVLVHFARYYDLLYNSPHFSAGSEAGQASIRGMVEENIIRNGAKFCYDQSADGHGGLTNGQADYIRGVMVAGLSLGDQHYIDWTLKGPYCIFNFLENNLDRDGQYYETSAGYSQHALALYVDMAEMLANYKTPEHPDGIDLYKHPKFANALIRGESDIRCAGHDPRYGDWGPDWRKLEAIDRHMLFTHMSIERIYRRSSPDEKKRLAPLLRTAAGGSIDEGRATMKSQYQATWLLFHAEPLVRTSSAKQEEDEKSILLDGKGLAILRSGNGIDGRAALVRYGSSVCHGHKDDLNLNFYALGRELTYDLGYSLGSAHVQVGWSKQTASHNLVVINEKSQLAAGPTGGSAVLFADAGLVKMAEVCADASYKSEGVSLYRRSLALIDSDPGCSYLVDIFRVKGGQTHDLSWHANGEKVAINGVEMGSLQEKGSLAGEDIDWGRRVGPDGDIVGAKDARPYWCPPPGNGYGFLYDIRRGQVNGQCSATWVVDMKEGEALKITLAPPSGCEMITATAPGILPACPKPQYAILRRKGADLESAFASVLQPFHGINPVADVRRMPIGDDDDMHVGLRIDLKNGCRDYVFSSVDPRDAVWVTDEGREIRFRAQFGFIRKSGDDLRNILLLGGTHLSVGGITLTTPQSGYWGRADIVDYAHCRFTTRRELPTDGSLVGETVYISRRDYSHKSAYRIKSISQEDEGYVVQLDTETLVLGKGFVSTEIEPGMHEVRNLIPLEKSTSCDHRDTGYFRGKLVEAPDGARSQIINVLAAGGKKTILVPDASIFSKGKSLTIYDIRSGDTFEIPTRVEASLADGKLSIRANVPATLQIRNRTIELPRGESRLGL